MGLLGSEQNAVPRHNAGALIVLTHEVRLLVEYFYGAIGDGTRKVEFRSREGFHHTQSSRVDSGSDASPDPYYAQAQDRDRPHPPQLDSRWASRHAGAGVG